MPAGCMSTRATKEPMLSSRETAACSPGQRGDHDGELVAQHKFRRAPGVDGHLVAEPGHRRGPFSDVGAPAAGGASPAADGGPAC